MRILRVLTAVMAVFLLVAGAARAQMTTLSGKRIQSGTLPQVALSATGTESSSTILFGDWVYRSLSGDVSQGALGALTVTDVQGEPWSSTAPTTGQVPVWSGSAWVPGSGGGGGVGTGAGLAYATAATTANVPTLSGGGTYGGVSLGSGQILLCEGQTTQSQNGPWVVASGAWARPTWYATGTSIPAAFAISVLEGGYAQTLQVLNSTGAITVDTSSTSWYTLFAEPIGVYVASAPLTGSGNLSSGVFIGITQANTSTDGYLSHTDWNTFNGKQSTLVWHQDVATGNGSTTTFTLSHTPLFSGLIQCFRGGQLLSTGYSVSGTTVTFSTAPRNTMTLQFWYFAST